MFWQDFIIGVGNLGNLLELSQRKKRVVKHLIKGKYKLRLIHTCWFIIGCTNEFNCVIDFSLLFQILMDIGNRFL